MTTPMRWLINRVLSFRQSIAFLPTLLAMLYLVLGLLAVLPLGERLPLPGLLAGIRFADIETPRTLLSTLIAAMISLTVFSFSMVMSVLTQAGGNFSHKLVFGLITERHHQRVLGHYLGTILFILMLLMVPVSGDVPSTWRSLSTYLGVAMVTHCLALFVYFIHNASQSVQINAVNSGLHQATRKSLAKLETRQQRPGWCHRPSSQPLQAHWPRIKARRSGYIQNADIEALARLAIEADVVVHLNFSFGDYTVEGFPLFTIEAAEAPGERFEASALGLLVYVEGEVAEDLYVNGMTQLMEVAVKALSPGINDPGTARLCLHQLTELLCRRLQFHPCNTFTDQQGKRRVVWKTERFDSLLYRLVNPILHYGKDDVSIGLALLKSLKTLSLFAEDAELTTIQRHAERVIATLAERDTHILDRQFIGERLASGEHRLSLPAELPTPKEKPVTPS
ncbi:Uncharacterized membrane protein [Onishia taeanensis]|uniref:Uncharacterized membrane protein n=1 Tax=Onishia taeanensis TaxID=284577 RepID=A0A1G7MYU4_9GAMM|nr:DUF2254 domain-containing protein [Halomonas taeanensis]SDF66841.1 Uncharacterized membrane protein [Halomonas taeanensis]